MEYFRILNKNVEKVYPEDQRAAGYVMTYTIAAITGIGLYTTVKFVVKKLFGF